MNFSKARRRKHVDILTHQFVPSIAKDLLGLRIHQNDLTVDLHDHHGVWCGFEQTAELLLSPPQFLSL